MIVFLKKTRLGKYLYRLSRRPRIGMPLRRIAGFLQSEFLRSDHFKPQNTAHNRKANAVLNQFLESHGLGQGK